MCFVRQTIIKMADKMAAAYQFASITCYGHCYLVIFNWISSKFNIWIASIKPLFKIKYEFCPTYDNQDGDKMAAAYHFASSRCCVHSNLVIFNQISSKFCIWIAFIELYFKFHYEFCLTNDNQDGRINGRRLSLCIHPLFLSLSLGHF